ncbi:1863_t:CDS:1, partial [Gigaspora margarita]
EKKRIVFLQEALKRAKELGLDLFCMAPKKESKRSLLLPIEKTQASNNYI